MPETSGQRGDTKGKGQAIFSHWESCGHARLTPPRKCTEALPRSRPVWGREPTGFLGSRQLPPFKGYNEAPLENWAIFPKGRIRSPTTEGYKGQHSPGFPHVRLRQLSKKTNIMRAEALDRQGTVWRRQLVRKRSRGRGQQQRGTWDMKPRRTEQAPWLFRRQTFSTDSAPHPSSPLQRAEGEGRGGQHQARTSNPPHSPRGHGTALQPCNDGDRKKQQDLSTEAESTQSHAISYTAL